MATFFPLLLELSHSGGLVLRKHSCEDGVDPEFVCDCFGDGFGVTGQHRHLDPPVVESLDCLSTLLTDRVGHREDCNRLTLSKEIDGSLTPLGCTFGQLPQVLGHLRPFCLQERRSA